MATFLTPQVIAKYRKTVNDLRNDLGVMVAVHSKIPATQCNNCTWDAVEKRSSGVYNGSGPKSFTHGKCPVCKGVGELPPQEATRSVKCTRIWMKIGDTNTGVAGEESSNTVRLRTDRGYEQLFKAADYVVFESTRMEVERTEPVGFNNISCQVTLRRAD